MPYISSGTMNRTAINRKANIELKKLFLDKGIYWCEVCGKAYILSFAHRHKRKWYYDKPNELLWDFNQVIIVCLICHDKMEKDSELTEQKFMSLRGEETKLKQLEDIK